MGLGNIFKAFQPKDKVFFVLFDEVVANLIEMAKVFHEGILEYNQNDETFLQKIRDFEHKNDDLTHKIFLELGLNFITPFDREDISALAIKMDDIADYIYASTKYIYLYKTPKMEEYSEFASLIHDACLELQKALKAMKDFKDPKTVKEACIKINYFENVGDDLHSKALVKLFETNDPMRIIKVQTVLNNLEEVTDKAEDVANILDNIIIKYA